MPGRYSNVTHATTCTQCLGGWAATNGGQTSCSGCAPGRFAQKGSQVCLDCPNTAFADRPQADVCVPCWDYSGATPSKTWCQCGVGWYEIPNPQALVFYNTTNPAVVSRLTGVDATPFKVNGQYRLPSCVKCPDGANCMAQGVRIGAVYAKAGYWPEVQGTNTKFIKCMSANCVGGANVCANNYTGHLCTECPEGLGRQGTFECSKCPDPTMNQLRMIGGIFLEIGLNTFLIWSTVTSDKSPTHSVLIKILTSCMQFNSLATKFQFKFPAFVDGIFTSQQSAASVGESFTSFDCLFGNNATPAPVYIKLIMYLLLVPICFGLPWPVINKLKERKIARQGATVEDRKAITEEHWNMYITAVVIAIFLQHPTISQVTLSMFNCMQIGCAFELFCAIVSPHLFDILQHADFSHV